MGFLLVAHHSQKLVVMGPLSPCTSQGCAQVPGLAMLLWAPQCDGAGGPPGTADTEAPCFLNITALCGLSHHLLAVNPADSFVSHPAASWSLLAAVLEAKRCLMGSGASLGCAESRRAEEMFLLACPNSNMEFVSWSGAKCWCPQMCSGRDSWQLPDMGPHLNMPAAVLPRGPPSIC